MYRSEVPGYVVLQDGTVFSGFGFGAHIIVFGICFSDESKRYTFRLYFRCLRRTSPEQILFRRNKLSFFTENSWNKSGKNKPQC